MWQLWEHIVGEMSAEVTRDRVLVSAAPGISSRDARLAGFAYLVTIVCGLFAQISVRGTLGSNDAATTAANIAAHESLYRLGEVSDLVMLCSYVVVTGLLYRLFALSQPVLAAVAAGFSLTGIAVLAVAGLLHMAPLALADHPALAGREAIAQLALDLHGTLYAISLVFFGAYCMAIGSLCLSSGFYPKLVGWLMILGGFTHFVTKFLWIAAPAALAFVPRPVNMLPLLGEAVLAVCLIAMGSGRRCAGR